MPTSIQAIRSRSVRTRSKERHRKCYSSHKFSITKPLSFPSYLKPKAPGNMKHFICFCTHKWAFHSFPQIWKHRGHEIRLYDQLGSTVLRSESSPTLFKISIVVTNNSSAWIYSLARPLFNHGVSAQTASNRWARSLCKFEPSVQVSLRRNDDQSE
jgi:hypothetical protein